MQMAVLGSLFNPVGSWPRKQRVLVYGSNQVPVSWPRLSTIATSLLQNPLLIIQVIPCCSSRQSPADHPGNPLLLIQAIPC